VDVFHHSHVRLLGTHKDNITFLLHLTVVLQSSTKLMIADECVASVFRLLCHEADDLQKLFEIKHDRASVVREIL
jgi:hypothetical protein